MFPRRKMLALLKYGFVMGFVTSVTVYLTWDHLPWQNSNDLPRSSVGEKHIRNYPPAVSNPDHEESEKGVDNAELRKQHASKKTSENSQVKTPVHPRKEELEKQESDLEDNQKVSKTITKDKVETQLDNDHKVAEDGNAQEKNEGFAGPKFLRHMGVVCCGDRFNETLISIKSALVMSKEPIYVHIFADDPNIHHFSLELDQWSAVDEGKLGYFVYPITYPYGDDKTWRELFKPCATQRLFLPILLRDVDSLLYMDTDVLFMRPIEEIWQFFNDFNSTQLAALAPEHEDASTSWYKRFARHPYYPPLGVNSGVMLMNLTRMRQVSWLDKIVAYYPEYRYQITWGDQDLINIYFHFFPEQLYIYTCQWNYRPDHCMYMSVCKPAEREGVQVLHGCRGVFHNDKSPVFKAVYEAFEEHPFDGSLTELADRMEKNIRDSPKEKYNCNKVGYLFSSGLRKLIQRRKNLEKPQL